QLLQVVLAHRPPFARPPDAVDDLLPTELFGDAGPLHHREYHRFGRGEPAAALRARTAPPDRLAVIHFPGIDHTRILVPAERAPHAATSGTSTTTHQPTHHTPCLRWTPRARIGDRLVDRRWTTHRLLWTTTSSATQIVEQLHACNYYMLGSTLERRGRLRNSHAGEVRYEFTPSPSVADTARRRLRRSSAPG